MHKVKHFSWSLFFLLLTRDFGVLSKKSQPKPVLWSFSILPAHQFLSFPVSSLKHLQDKWFLGLCLVCLPLGVFQGQFLSDILFPWKDSTILSHFFVCLLISFFLFLFFFLITGNLNLICGNSGNQPDLLVFFVFTGFFFLNCWRLIVPRTNLRHKLMFCQVFSGSFPGHTWSRSNFLCISVVSEFPCL